MVESTSRSSCRSKKIPLTSGFAEHRNKNKLVQCGGGGTMLLQRISRKLHLVPRQEVTVPFSDSSESAFAQRLRQFEAFQAKKRNEGLRRRLFALSRMLSTSTTEAGDPLRISAPLMRESTMMTPKSIQSQIRPQATLSPKERTRPESSLDSCGGFTMAAAKSPFVVAEGEGTHFALNKDKEKSQAMMMMKQKKLNSYCTLTEIFSGREDPIKDFLLSHTRRPVGQLRMASTISGQDLEARLSLVVGKMTRHQLPLSRTRTIRKQRSDVGLDCRNRVCIRLPTAQYCGSGVY